MWVCLLEHRSHSRVATCGTCYCPVHILRREIIISEIWQWCCTDLKTVMGNWWPQHLDDVSMGKHCNSIFTQCSPFIFSSMYVQCTECRCPLQILVTVILLCPDVFTTQVKFANLCNCWWRLGHSVYKVSDTVNLGFASYAIYAESCTAAHFADLLVCAH